MVVDVIPIVYRRIIYYHVANPSTVRVAMARRLIIDWQDDPEALFRRYRAEADSERRTRWHALWLVRQGHRPQDAAQLVGVQLRTLRTWLAWYREGGTPAIRQHRHGGRQGRRPFLTAEQRAPQSPYRHWRDHDDRSGGCVGAEPSWHQLYLLGHAQPV
jgi:hypothetical protein